MRHALNDLISMDLATAVARGLPDHPEWLDLARGNLERWTTLNASSPGLLACYAEWRAVLDRPVPEIMALLTSRGDEGQRLRQNSPFAGALSAQEVWDIKRKRRDEHRAA